MTRFFECNAPFCNRRKVSIDGKGKLAESKEHKQMRNQFLIGENGIFLFADLTA